MSFRTPSGRGTEDLVAEGTVRMMFPHKRPRIRCAAYQRLLCRDTRATGQRPLTEFHEANGYNEATVRFTPPSARHISEMDEALQWMMLLTIEPESTRKLVWLRASKVRWKAIRGVSAIAGPNCIPITGTHCTQFCWPSNEGLLQLKQPSNRSSSSDHTSVSVWRGPCVFEEA